MHKKHENTKQTIFNPISNFFAREKFLSVLFSVRLLCLVSYFLLDLRFCTFQIFSLKKKKKHAWNCPDNLKYNTTGVHPYQLTYREFIYKRLCSWQSARCFYIIICQKPFLPARIHLSLCFLSVRIHFQLYTFVWILKHQKYWYSLCWKHCDVNNFWLNYEY